MNETWVARAFDDIARFAAAVCIDNRQFRGTPI